MQEQASIREHSLPCEAHPFNHMTSRPSRHTSRLAVQWWLGAFRPEGAAFGHYAFLDGTHVKDVMQYVCVLAYPNPKHYVRQHIHFNVSHSNCFTAAVASFLAGESIELITL